MFTFTLSMFYQRIDKVNLECNEPKAVLKGFKLCFFKPLTIFVRPCSNSKSSFLLSLTPSKQSQDARRYRKTFFNYKLFIRVFTVRLSPRPLQLHRAFHGAPCYNWILFDGCCGCELCAVRGARQRQVANDNRHLEHLSGCHSLHSVCGNLVLHV